MTINEKAKRAWFITDTHLGIRNNSNEWIEVMRDYFFNWFFPLVESEYQEGDVLIHLGDFYDSRQSVNLKVLDLGMDVAEKASSIFKDGIYVIVGNHDIWGKNSNDVNSLKTLKWVPNFNIFEEPASLKLGDSTFLMMPWRKDHQAEKDLIESSNPHDYLCCHTDVSGMRFNKYVKIDHGNGVESFSKFKKVYSGHIHFSQNLGNIRMLGSPYELTRSDMGNEKFILRLDISSGEEKVFVNSHSPKFKRVNLKTLLNMTMEDIDTMFDNSFVDVMVDPSLAVNVPLNVLTDNITSSRRISFHPYDNKVEGDSIQMYDIDGKDFNVLDFIKEYIKGLNHDESTKEKLEKSLLKIYKKITAADED